MCTHACVQPLLWHNGVIDSQGKAMMTDIQTVMVMLMMIMTVMMINYADDDDDGDEDQPQLRHNVSHHPYWDPMADWASYCVGALSTPMGTSFSIFRLTLLRKLASVSKSGIRRQTHQRLNVAEIHERTPN